MAADMQDRLPIFDYDVISDGGPKNRKSGEKPKPGDNWDEPVWKEEPPDGNMNHGDLTVGTVKIHAKGSEEDPEFDADFTFTTPPNVRIKVDGKVPGKDKWVGKGKAHAKGEGREDHNIEIEFRNPKRW
jgi:hypothetical protein